MWSYRAGDLPMDAYGAGVSEEGGGWQVLSGHTPLMMYYFFGKGGEIKEVPGIRSNRAWAGGSWERGALEGD